VFGLESRPFDIDLPLWGLHSTSMARALQIVSLTCRLLNLVYSLSDLKLKIRIASDSPPKPLLHNIDIYLTSENVQSIYESALEDVKNFKRSNTRSWDKLSREVYSQHRNPCPTAVDAAGESSVISHVIHSISGLS